MGDLEGLCYLEVMQAIVDDPTSILTRRKARKLAWQATREGFNLEEEELVQALEIDTHMMAEKVQGGYRFKARA